MAGDDVSSGHLWRQSFDIMAKEQNLVCGD